jgi:hypothetical protein
LFWFNEGRNIRQCDQELPRLLGPEVGCLGVHDASGDGRQFQIRYVLPTTIGEELDAVHEPDPG